ncbi:YbaK/EbsC family protein [Candidatus Woesearchaeota archaeon]|nr:YbaK/EbsC family protein [Candidatus Woesearchaeota archaeon]
MNEYEKKLKEYMQKHSIRGEYMAFRESCHSAEEAAITAKADIEDFIKNICLAGANGEIIVALVKAMDRASTTKIGKLLNIERPRTATPDEILQKTGYPVGGVPSFGYPAMFLIDYKVMEKEKVYTSGGTPNSLIRIPTKELQRANRGEVANIRK